MPEHHGAGNGVLPILGGREFVVDLAPWHAALTRNPVDRGIVHRVGLAMADWCSMLWQEKRSVGDPTETDLDILHDEFVKTFSVPPSRLARAIRVLAKADCVAPRFSTSERRTALRVQSAWVPVPARAALPIRSLAAFCRDARTPTLPMIAVLRTIAEAQVHRLCVEEAGLGVAITVSEFLARTGIRAEQIQRTLHEAVMLGFVARVVAGNNNRAARWALTPRVFHGTGVLPAPTETDRPTPGRHPESGTEPTRRDNRLPVVPTPPGRPVARVAVASATSLGTVSLPNGIVFTVAAGAAPDQMAALLQQLASLAGGPDPE